MVLFNEPDTMYFPSGENATDNAKSECLSNGLEMASSVFASQRQMMLSNELDTMCFPSGDNTTDSTELEWTYSGLEMESPVFASQR